ncbi:MAG: hypothetical protein QGG14_00180 [Planctomycetota bacterium]|nr:hypothetical protein [Planctomycetota bacterium]
MIAMIPPNRPNLIKLSAVACLTLCVLGCTTTTIELIPPDMSPRPVRSLARWGVEMDGRRVGSLVLIRVEDRDHPEQFYVVKHADGQTAGKIDLQGRAWREEPFRDRPVLVAMDTMAQDLMVLLELPRQPAIVLLEADD